MYSIVMLAAMSAAPETADFCCKKSYCCESYYAGCSGCYGGCAGYGYGCGGYGGGCCICSKGGYGYGGGCCFCGCLCKVLSCFCCCGKGGYGYGCGGYGDGSGGYGYGYGGPVIVATAAQPTANEAEVIVRVPANATLFANGQPTELTGTQRIFRTPALTPGRDFSYELRVEYAAQGETKTAKRQITVRANHRTTVDFTERATSAVTVSLPANSKLTVDGIDTRMTGGKHTFQTPELTKGQPVSYEFRAEIERNGQTQVLTQKVSFKAGEPVEVDFIEAAERTVAK